MFEVLSIADDGFVMMLTGFRWIGASVFALAFIAASHVRLSQAATVEQGQAFNNRGDYPAAASILLPLAEAGSARAQAIVGSMHETGRGLPQNITIASYWYRRAAEQGYSPAQYLLGLQYDRGIGVDRNIIEAQKWLILATAAARKPTDEGRARIRDAVLSKMTRGEIAEARYRAAIWIARPER